MIDFGAIVSQLFSSYWWLLPLLVLLVLFKSAWFKGLIGLAMCPLRRLSFVDILKLYRYHPMIIKEVALL